MPQNISSKVHRKVPYVLINNKKSNYKGKKSAKKDTQSVVSVDPPQRNLSDVPVEGKEHTVPQVSKDPLVTAITDLLEEIKALRLDISTASLRSRIPTVSC